MQITRTSIYTGMTRTRDIDVTQEQIDRWEQGEMIQRVMPNVSVDDREFIMSGSTPEEWNEIFPEE